jgi:microcystin degradation protein MlrC
MAGELLDGVRAAKAAGGIDAVYFSMHGAKLG